MIICQDGSLAPLCDTGWSPDEKGQNWCCEEESRLFNESKVEPLTQELRDRGAK